MHKQLGISLVSMLIGLMISSLCILVSLTLYKDMVHVTAESKIGAMHDGQLATAMLTLQLEVQTAGYGIEAADTDDVVVVDGDNEIGLRWRYHNGTEFKCRGFLETQQLINGTQYRVLKMQSSTGSCNDTTPLANMTYSDETIIARWPVINELTTYLAGKAANDRTLLDITRIDNSTCSPFGATASDAHLMVQVTSPSAALLNGAANVALNSYTYCLPNTAPAS